MIPVWKNNEWLLEFMRYNKKISWCKLTFISITCVIMEMRQKMYFRCSACFLFSFLFVCLFVCFNLYYRWHILKHLCIVFLVVFGRLSQKHYCKRKFCCCLHRIIWKFTALWYNSVNYVLHKCLHLFCWNTRLSIISSTISRDLQVFSPLEDITSINTIYSMLWIILMCKLYLIE